MKSTNALDDYVERYTHSNLDVSTTSEVVDRSLTQSGQSLVQLSAAPRLAIKQSGVRIVLVRMGYTETLRSLLVKSLLVKYELARLDRMCDPSQELYRAFGLKRGTFQQLFELKVLRRGFLGGVLVDDSRQMLSPPNCLHMDSSENMPRERMLEVALIRAATVAVHPAFVSLTRDLILERTSGQDRRARGMLGPGCEFCKPSCCLASDPGNLERASGSRVAA